ncbi:hypothetical protein [Streptomyces sp. NPDC005890]
MAYADTGFRARLSGGILREQIEELVTRIEDCSPIRDTLVSPVDVVTTLA